MLLLIGFSFYAPYSFGQVKEDLDFIMKFNNIKEVSEKVSTFKFQEVSEAKLALISLIRFYQTFISSQDVSVCNFTLSCSRFSVLSIQRYGIFFGLLMTSDRLQRCNGLGRKYYPIDSKTGLAIDYPIDYYYLGKPKGSFSKKNEIF